MKTAAQKKLINNIHKSSKAMHRGIHGCHGFDHTERVLALAKHIARAEGADVVTVEIAALLHDIGRKKEDQSRGKICHAIAGASIAKRLLKKYGTDDKTTDDVIHCIERHRFRKGLPPESLEAKVIFDADKLDAIGAVGLGRAFLFAGEQGAMLHNEKHTDIKRTRAYSREDTAWREFVVKLQHVRKKLMTREGKRIAKERHAFMLDFFKRLNAEISGKL